MGSDTFQSYFNALTDELKVKMENDNFVVPVLNNLNNKKEQIDALQIVREHQHTQEENTLYYIQTRTQRHHQWYRKGPYHFQESRLQSKPYQR